MWRKLGGVMGCLKRLGFVVAAWGCEDPLVARALVEDYRVLGIVAEPPEVAVDGVVQVAAAEALPAGATHAWQLCLASFGAGSEYACLEEAIELEAAGPTLTLDLAALGVAERLEALATARGSTLDALLAEGHTLWLELNSGPPQKRVRTVKRIEVRDTPAQGNPVIEAFSVPATAQVGEKLELSVVASGEESYTDVTGATVDEELLVCVVHDGGPPRSAPHGGQRPVGGAAPAGRGGAGVGVCDGARRAGWVRGGRGGDRGALIGVR
jgi:hypothetical protein